jgi:hypothetical protein
MLFCLILILCLTHSSNPFEYCKNVNFSIKKKIQILQQLKFLVYCKNVNFSIKKKIQILQQLKFLVYELIIIV